MSWVASVLSVEVSGDNLAVRVQFSGEGLAPFERVLTTQGVPAPNWLKDNLQAVVNNAVAMATYAAQIVPGDVVVTAQATAHDVDPNPVP